MERATGWCTQVIWTRDHFKLSLFITKLNDLGTRGTCCTAWNQQVLTLKREFATKREDFSSGAWPKLKGIKVRVGLKLKDIKARTRLVPCWARQ
jgi:hypothetical protein